MVFLQMLLDESQLRAIVAAVVVELSQPRSERLAYNLREASEVTGIPERQIALAVARRELPARKIGKAYRVTRQSLLNWLDSTH